MRKIKFLLLITMSLFAFNSCEEDPETTIDLNFISFVKSVYSAGVDVGGSITIDIPVYTNNVTGSNRTFNVYIDEEKSNAATSSYSIPSSVTIESGTNKGILSVTLSDVDLGIGVNKLVIDFESVPELFNGGNTTINYIQNCNEVTATLDITFDYYAEETGWKILDALGDVVTSKPAGSYPNGTAPTSESISLCAGRDYTLIFTDAYGDGMNDGDNFGSYTLTIGDVVKAIGGGSFGASESTDFDTN